MKTGSKFYLPEYKGQIYHSSRNWTNAEMRCPKQEVKDNICCEKDRKLFNPLPNSTPTTKWKKKAYLLPIVYLVINYYYIFISAKHH